MVNFNLPLEILIEIFSRLPAKSVGKCRCVAKSWRDLLSTTQFIESHFSRSRDQENLIIITSSHSTYSIKADGVARHLEFPNKFIEVVGSCNGLVLLANKKCTYSLVNPVVMRQVRIPYNTLPLGKEDYSCNHGFGYDKFSDDYKIVRISFQEVELQYVDSVDTFVEVYSVKRGIWKRVRNSPYNHYFPFSYSGVFVNGAIHWVAHRLEPGLPFVIAAFNLVDETFDEVAAPVDVEQEPDGVAVLGGCLCIYETRSFCKMDFWIMKEYGVRESWTKFKIDVSDDYLWDFVKPLHFIRDEDVVLLSGGNTLVVYNLKERTLRDLFVDGVVDGATFIESLVLPPRKCSTIG